MEDRPPAPPPRPVGPTAIATPLALVGAGVAARALHVALAGAGWPFAGLALRDPEASRIQAAAWGLSALGSPDRPAEGLRTAPVVLLAVRDSSIREVAERLAAHAGPWSGRVVLHLSGALSSDEASPLRDQGAAVASWHPLATLGLPDAVRPGIPFFAEGDDEALRVAAALTAAVGGRFQVLPAGSKPAYHAAATLGGNLVTVLVAAAADVLRREGVEEPERALAMLARASVEAALGSPGLSALTGPVARADAPTLDANVRALRDAPAAIRAAHAALSWAANERLRSEGRGSDEARADVERVLRAELEAAVADLTGASGRGDDPVRLPP